MAELEGPDPNDIRRHQKRMLTDREYRLKYRRIDFYRPNYKQEDFHNLLETERMIRAGNQQGKTQCAAAQMTFDSLGLYPGWYKGRKFLIPPAIERPYDFIGWYGCTTSGKTRDGAQVKLLGDIRQEGGLGTGLIPLDNIVGRPTMNRGISDFVDTVTLTREVGGTGILRGKTFEMGREAWQGEPVDVVWGDEDPGDMEIYEECQARLTTTDGIIIWSMSPMLGVSPIRKHFKQKSPGTAEVLMTIYDAAVSKRGHIPDERIPGIIARYKGKAATRAFGADAQGEGAVFETPRDKIEHTLDPADVPPYWPWLWAFDFRHSGQESSGHPFAAVLACWDRDANVIYIMYALRMFGMASTHVAAMKQIPRWQAPVSWPHDGGRGAGLQTNDTIAKTYKNLGMNMRPEHAHFPESHGGGNNFEAGITEMEERFDKGQLKVAKHLVDWFDEYSGYHRKDGLVVKVDDDLMSATRNLCMDIRNARTVENFPNYRRDAARAAAASAEFDLFTGAPL